MIQLSNLSLSAGSFALHDVSLQVPDRHYAILMGATGTGKTTLLEAIAGLSPVTAGSIVLGDRNITRLRPAERNIGYVPQDGALFNKMTVRENMAFALVSRGATKEFIEQRVHDLAVMLGISNLLHRGVRKLSGGEKQRVALGRALASKPSILLLDEPLSALDEKTRNQMYELLRQVQRDNLVTVLHVTHHLADARALADTLFHLSAQGIEQIPSDKISAWIEKEAGASPAPGI